MAKILYLKPFSIVFVLSKFLEVDTSLKVEFRVPKNASHWLLIELALSTTTGKGEHIKQDRRN